MINVDKLRKDTTLAFNMETIQNELRRIPTAQNSMPVPPYESNNPTNLQPISTNTQLHQTRVFTAKHPLEISAKPGHIIHPKKKYTLLLFTGTQEEWRSH